MDFNEDKLAPLIKNETSRAVLLSTIFIHFVETCRIKNFPLIHEGKKKIVIYLSNTKE